MSKVTVMAGPCRLVTTIEAQASQRGKVTFEITSQCKELEKIADELGEVDVYAEIFTKYASNKITQAAQKYCKHSSCPVPCGIMKALEVAGGTALAVSPEITVEK